MARVTYTGVVSDLSGSVAGTTFQKNASGSVARSKATQSFAPSVLQGASRNTFAQVSAFWSKLDLSTQLNWNSYAAAHPLYDRWGNVKTLTGFQYYMQSNINLLSLGISIIPTPPVFVPQEVVPNYEITAYSNSLHLDFFPAIYYPDCDLVVYASAPTTSSSLMNRKNIWLIGGFSSPNGSIFDIKSFYESSFGVTWGSFFNSSSCNIVFQVILVNRVTGIASPFKGFILSLRNAPEPIWSELGSSLSVVATLGANRRVYEFLRLSNLSVLAFTEQSNQVFISSDNGSSWNFLSSFPFAGYCRSAALSTTGDIYACTSDAGSLAFSSDNGLSWSNAGSFLGSNGSRSVIVLPSGVILVSSSSGGLIYRSSDNGVSWSTVLSLGSTLSCYSFTYLEAGIVIAVFSITASAYISTDEGLTWNIIPYAWGVASLVGCCYCGNGIILISSVSTGQIFRSTDYGLTWSASGQLYSLTSIIKVLYFGNGVCFAFSSNSAVFLKSSDYGISWSLCSVPAGPSNFQSMFKTASDKFLVGSGNLCQILQ